MSDVDVSTSAGGAAVVSAVAPSVVRVQAAVEAAPSAPSASARGSDTVDLSNLATIQSVRTIAPVDISQSGSRQSPLRSGDSTTRQLADMQANRSAQPISVAVGTLMEDMGRLFRAFNIKGDEAAEVTKQFVTEVADKVGEPPKASLGMRVGVANWRANPGLAVSGAQIRIDTAQGKVNVTVNDVEIATQKEFASQHGLGSGAEPGLYFGGQQTTGKDMYRLAASEGVARPDFKLPESRDFTGEAVANDMKRSRFSDESSFLSGLGKDTSFAFGEETAGTAKETSFDDAGFGKDSGFGQDTGFGFGQDTGVGFGQEAVGGFGQEPAQGLTGKPAADSRSQGEAVGRPPVSAGVPAQAGAEKISTRMESGFQTTMDTNRNGVADQEDSAYRATLVVGTGTLVEGAVVRINFDALVPMPATPDELARSSSFEQQRKDGPVTRAPEVNVDVKA